MIDITSEVDRSGLNVKGVKSTKKKKIFVICGFLMVMISIAIALSLVKAKLEKMSSENGEEQEVPEEVENFQEGSKRTAVGSELRWLVEARKKLEIEPAATAQPVNVTPPETKPAPKVVSTNIKDIENDVTEYENERPLPKVRFSNKTPATTEPTEPPPPTPEELALARKLGGSLSVASKGSQTVSGINSGETLGFGGSEYDESFDGSVFESRTAKVRRKGDLNFVLPHGSSIPCALYTQIISDYSGFVTCRVTQDVYSANGAVLLVERGSLVSGTQNVAMEAGKGRVFTKWAEIETPDGVLVRIDSLGTGPLGAAGNNVWVDNHYFERFSGAIMLSFVDDALATASDNMTTGVVMDSSMSNIGNIAAQTLEQTLNIPPTGYSKIGQRINILVVRDVDFSPVYELERL
ncbi:TrbI/VirB10 family protein [Vibrio vulnificus]|uniref:TrbI/VirB10 family protein n=1 Tax=Vibrio vulnificus TaxID=672 RepID=UPI0040593073